MKIQVLKPAGYCLLLSAVMMAASCQKDLRSSNTDASAAALSDSSTAADNAYSDGLTNAFYGYADNVATAVENKRNGVIAVNSTAGNSVRPQFSCAVATVTSTDGSFPVTLSLDFGTGCTSTDSITRKGKITCTYSAPLYTSGAVVSVSFDKYYVNSYGLQGIYSITNTSADSVPQFVARVSNGIFSYPDGTNFHYTSNKIVTMTGGTSTPFYFPDDVYSITGNGNFSSSSGNSVVLTVTTPLLKSLVCPSISSGVISFVYNTSIKGTIDFGNGDCDNSATLTAGSLVKTIALR